MSTTKKQTNKIPIGHTEPFEVVINQLIQSGLNPVFLARVNLPLNVSQGLQSRLLRCCMQPQVKAYLTDFHAYHSEGEPLSLTRFLYVINYFYRVSPELKQVCFRRLSHFLYLYSIYPLQNHYSTAAVIEATMYNSTSRLPQEIMQIIELTK